MTPTDKASHVGSTAGAPGPDAAAAAAHPSVAKVTTWPYSSSALPPQSLAERIAAFMHAVRLLAGLGTDDEGKLPLALLISASIGLFGSYITGTGALGASVAAESVWVGKRAG